MRGNKGKNEEAVEAEVRSSLGKDGQLTCAAAQKIAGEVGVEPLEVGKKADEIDIRITRCQLGLFGYAPKKGMPGYKLVKKLGTLPEPVSASVRKAVSDGKIPCLKLWGIAEQHKLTRSEIGNVVETLGIKVSPCQLGCF